MEWQAVVLAVQILMLAVGWVLFQKAKADLSAQAAETPVLGELRALKSQIKQLLDEIETAGDAASSRLEAQCRDANALLVEMEARRVETETLLQNSAPLAATERFVEHFAPLAASAVIETAPKKSPRRAKSTGAETATTATAEKPIPTRRTKAVTETAAVAEAVALVGMAARRQQVYALADEGKAMPAIARETDMSVGEVETLIGLRGR